MAATSTVGPVKAAVKTLLASTLTSAQVIYGRRGPFVKNDLVIVGNARGTVTPATLGPTRKRDEVYLLEVTVLCSRPNTTDQQSVTEAALALYTAAENAIRAHAGENLGVTNVMWARPTGDFELVEADDPEVLAKATEAAVTFTVEVKARI